MAYRKRKSTNQVHVKYTEIIDLQTVAGKTSIIGIHSPIGINPARRLNGLWCQFRYVRYNGAKMTMVPAQNLPVDPLGLTSMVGTTEQMDPRDALNPILSHGCHGEHLGRILDNIYNFEQCHVGNNGVPVSSGSSFGENNSDSATKIEMPNALDDALSRYYQCLTDVTWKKHGIQAPMHMRMYPLVNRIQANMTFGPNGGSPNGALMFKAGAGTEPGPLTPIDSGNMPVDTFSGTVNGINYDTPNQLLTESGYREVPNAVQLFTNGVTRMGWIPTTTTDSAGQTILNHLPKQFMSVLVMPPSYNVEQFFRMSITHSYSFAGFTTSLGGEELGSRPAANNVNSYFNWIDYDVTSNKCDSTYVEGSTLDLIDADAKVIADGVR